MKDLKNTEDQYLLEQYQKNKKYLWINLTIGSTKLVPRKL